MRKGKFLPLALLAALLAGCSLARPERGPARDPFGDRFAGFYVMYYAGHEEAAEDFYRNPHLTEYGSESVSADGFGSFELPRRVLFLEEGGAPDAFPGLEGGYSLILLSGGDGRAITVVSNMAPGASGAANSVRVTDEGSESFLSGAIYCGPPPGETERGDGGLWKAYNVYQAPDGRAYLDGGGNSFSGGGSFGFGKSEEYTAEAGGKSATDRVEVHVDVEAAPRLERLTVTQFDGNNAAVRSDDLPLGDDPPEVACEGEAVWVLVEETGPAGAARTAYNVPEEGEDPVSHQVVLLDGEGLGRLAYLRIRRGGG